MDTLTLIKQPIEADLSRFAQIFDETLSHDNPLLNAVFQHIRARKGKQMRPALLLLVARMLGQPSQATYLAAVMLELLHTASLVHDDIVDESDERRGQASVNALYDNKVAVLVGDYLLSSTLEKASQTHNFRIVERVSRLGKELASGEIIQLSNTQRTEFSIESYYEVINLKTAKLFAATAEMGAVSVEADDATVEQMKAFGEALGMCFQVKDDIFDYFADARIGKPTGNDMLEGKLTLPVLWALHAVGDAAIHDLARAVRRGEATPDDIQRLVDFTKQNGGIEAAEAVMEDYAVRAQQLIAPYPATPYKQAIEQYIAYVKQRNY